MKGVRQLCTGLALAVVMVGGQSLAATGGRILNSRHNFQTGTGNIKANPNGAQTEDGICVFCHTPHKGRSSLLLWNHQMSAEQYEWKDITAAGGTATTGGTSFPKNLQSWSGSTAKCLSCHDGTVSVGAIYWSNATGTKEVAMTGGDNGKINDLARRITRGQDGAGTANDLSGNHPVGVPVPLGNVRSTYNSVSTGDNAMASGWKTLTEAVNNGQGVKIFGPGGGGGATEGNAGIECASCHDPHGTDNDYFLRVTKANSQLCLSCHNK